LQLICNLPLTQDNVITQAGEPLLFGAFDDLSAPAALDCGYSLPSAAWSA